MSLYKKHVLPRIINSICSAKSTSKLREAIIPIAYGRVLEVGIGSGLNLPYYNVRSVKKIIGVDPSLEMWKLNKWQGEIDINFIIANAEELPFEDNIFDSVVCTYTLCTIPNAEKALKEMSRVLKPSGKLLFAEHGLAPDRKVFTVQNKINPIWKKLAGGCNINRDVEKLIATAAFQFSSFDKMYIPGWKPASFNYWGIAINKK